MSNGPNEHERKVLAVNDTFYALLDRKDHRAAQLAQELAAVAAKYELKQRKDTNQ
jgi:hypothetical protein